MTETQIEGAKLVGGVWLPATEVHFEDMMLHNKKARLFRDGKATYQIRKLDRAMGFVPKDRRRVAIDIGAHVGLWSMWLIGLFREVEAFEPVPLHQRLFRENILPGEWGELDGPHHYGVMGSTECALWPVALGETAGFVDIETPEETTGNAHVAIGKRHPGTKHVQDPDRQYVVKGVIMRSLDSFDFREVDFIKIDVEGFELPVVKGARETILREKPVIVIEQKGNESAYGDPKDAAVEYLKGLGMKPLDCISGDWVMGW